MIAAKFLSILIISSIYDLEFYVDNQLEGLYSVQIFYTDSNTTLFVNSISDLVMLIVLAIPTFYFIIKTSIYQTTFQNPRTVVKITRLNILKWITKQDTSFLQIFIWSSFLLIASIVSVTHSMQNSTYQWVGIVAGVISLFSIWGTIKTYELETDKIYPKENTYY